MSEEETQKLQNKVDRLKLLNLTSNIHNLTPPQRQEDDGERDIALVKALSVTPRILSMFLKIRGLNYDPRSRQLIQVTTPIMNVDGAYRFCEVLKVISEETEWSSFSEEEIPQRIIHYFEINFPYFIFHAEKYDLDASDFNYIETTLQSFIDSAFHKAKSGKYINTLGRTYGEDIMKKALDTQGEKMNKSEEGFLSKYNPFKDRK